MRQNRVRLIGITGGIGSGKSTVSSYLKKKGFKVIDFDLISKKIYLKGMPSYDKIVDIFGIDILDKDSEIDRSRLADIVFSDSNKLNILEDIAHQEIYNIAKKEIDKLAYSEDIIFLDIPLLFETEEYLKKFNIDLEEIWLIYIDREKQIERVKKRDSLDREDIIKRIESQMDIEEKLYRADRVIYNDKGIDELYNGVNKALSAIKSQN